MSVEVSEDVIDIFSCRCESVPFLNVVGEESLIRKGLGALIDSIQM